MNNADHRDHAEVIDRTDWIAERVDRLLQAGRFDDAIGYLRMLWGSLREPADRLRCSTSLGYLYLLGDDLDAAHQWLTTAGQTATDATMADDPHRLYALGQVARHRRQPALATLFFLEAFVETSDHHDEAEFLRSAALSMMTITGPQAPVASMLLGALDRDLGNPYILDALSQVYAAEERWIESLKTLTRLRGILENAKEALVVYRGASDRQLLRDRLLGHPVGFDEVHRRTREINQAVREHFAVVLDDRHRRGSTQLAALRVHPSLARLIRALEDAPRASELLETAHHLWARVQEANFREVLGSRRIAAALHVLTERIQWRIPTSLDEIADHHRTPATSVDPAARVIAAQLGLRLIDVSALAPHLDPAQHPRLEHLSAALLFGEPLASARAPVIRLG